MDDDVAMNEALSENLFVGSIAMLNKLPLFIIGKPGTSKTLTIQVLQANLQGRRSHDAIFQKFPALAIIQYQCSPMSSSDAIQRQYDTARLLPPEPEATLFTATTNDSYVLLRAHRRRVALPLKLTTH